MKDIYIVFSHTPYKIGTFIRTFTREEYNHASIMFDPEMKEPYTFGRNHIDTPFWGGYIKDSVTRYTYKNTTASVAICRISVEDEKFDHALKTAREMFKNREIYVYNLFAAFFSIFHRRVFIENSFTCVECTCYFLSLVTDRVDKNGFYSVGELYEVFKNDTVYRGIFNIKGEEDTGFNTRKGFGVSVSRTFKSVAELIRRMNHRNEKKSI